MTHLRKMMPDTLADISLLLSFTPNLRMQRIESLSAWIVKTGECSPSPNYDTVETIAAKRMSHDC